MISKLLENFSVKQVLEMFDLLPDIIFWIKDTESRVIYGNQNFVEHIGYKTLAQVLGKTDHDFSPSYVAKQFIVDDRKVMAGETVTDRLEMNKSSDGELSWFSTSKRPLFDDSQKIIGTYGVTRHLSKTVQSLSGVDQVKQPVEYIKLNFSKPISIDELARMSHLSISALERRFKKYLFKTPKQFISEVRLQNARRLLTETSLTISEVAYQTGFDDPSYFSRQFKRLFNQLPSECRQQFLDSL